MTMAANNVRVEVELDDAGLWRVAASLIMDDERLNGHIVSMWVTVDGDDASPSDEQ